MVLVLRGPGSDLGEQNENLWCLVFINVDQDNWQTRLEKLESKLNSWKPRSLSFVGKALIVNVLGASKLWFPPP